MARTLQTETRSATELAFIEWAERGADAAGARRDAIEMLRRIGLPSRRVEAWHYTDLRILMGRLAANDATAKSAEFDNLLAPLIAGSHVVDIHGGSQLPSVDGVKIEGSTDAAEWSLAPNHLDRPVDSIRLLNAAFGGRGVSLSVDDGTIVPAPIELRTSPGGAHARLDVVAGSGSKATFVERLEGDSAAVPSTGVTRLTVGAGATVVWIVDQAKSRTAAHLAQLNVSVGKDATFKLFLLNSGGALVRYEVHAETKGEGSETRIRGVNLLETGQHIDVTTTLNHTAPNTVATETFRNVLTGGHGVFQGMIKVARGAQKTDAKMACNTLLLSNEGDFSAKPELEIFADDVQCGHGATAGEINSDHMFYLMSRGIPEPTARALLVKAFVAEMVEELDEEGVAEGLMARIDSCLDKAA